MNLKNLLPNTLLLTIPLIFVVGLGFLALITENSSSDSFLGCTVARGNFIPSPTPCGWSIAILISFLVSLLIVSLTKYIKQKRMAETNKSAEDD